jgi:hypothetical protein
MTSMRIAGIAVVVAAMLAACASDDGATGSHE